MTVNFWSGSRPLLLVDHAVGLALEAAERQVLEPLLLRRLLQVLAEVLGGGTALVAGRGEGDERVVRQEGALLRVDRHQRRGRLLALAEQLRVTGRVALVVVVDRLLLDRDRADVRQAAALGVGGGQVRQEGERGVAVVHGAGLDLLDVVDDLRVGQVLGGQVAGPVRRGEVGADRGVQAGGGELGVGLAELERAPLGVAERAPALRVRGQAQHVAPAQRLLRPAERLRHRPRHRDHQRRLRDRRDVAVGHQAGPVGLGELLLQKPDPGRGRRGPHVRCRAAVAAFVPATAQGLGRATGGLAADLEVGALAAERAAGLLVPFGELAEQRGLLRRRADHERHAVLTVTRGAARLVAGVIVWPEHEIGADDRDQPDHHRDDQRGWVTPPLRLSKSHRSPCPCVRPSACR